MENEFSFSKNYVAIFAAAKKIGNIQDMQDCFDELCSEAGIQNDIADLSGATAGKRLADMLNAKQTGKSFEGSTPGKKI